MYLYEDETGKYIVGADSVPKKLGDITGTMNGDVFMLYNYHNSGSYRIDVKNIEYIDGSDLRYTIKKCGRYKLSTLHFPYGGASSQTKVTINGVEVIRMEYLGGPMTKHYEWDANVGDEIVFSTVNMAHTAYSISKITLL